MEIKQKQKQKEKGKEEMAISDLSKKAQWITFALSSGACAAINGVFAKLFVDPWYIRECEY